MKRYLLFATVWYYPAGGWGDFQAAFDTIEEAKAAAPGWADSFHVIDKETGEEVASG
jgi:hypothetical protein